MASWAKLVDKEAKCVVLSCVLKKRAGISNACGLLETAIFNWYHMTKHAVGQHNMGYFNFFLPAGNLYSESREHSQHRGNVNGL